MSFPGYQLVLSWLEVPAWTSRSVELDGKIVSQDLLNASVCIFHGNLNHVKSWFKIAKSRDHVKFRDLDPLPHGSNENVWIVKEFKQTGR